MMTDSPIYTGTISMVTHYSLQTYDRAMELRAVPGGLYDRSLATFDVNDFKLHCWLFDYAEAMNENDPTVDKMLGLLSRLTCAANMTMFYPISTGESIIFQNSGILNEEFLGHPKTSTFTLRITNEVEELMFYNGVYFDRDYEFVVHIPGTGIELES